MLLEKDYDENLWTYSTSKKLNNVFTVEVCSNNLYYSFEFYFKFPNEFKIEVYTRKIDCPVYMFHQYFEYKRFEYALTKLRYLIDYHSNGEFIHTFLHEINYQDLLRHLKYLTQATEV